MNVIITGASRGIGYAIAEVFAKHGHQLFITSRNEFNLYKAVEELQTVYGAEVHAKPYDLSIKQSAISFGMHCLDFGAPDILINNSGMFTPGDIATESDGALEAQINTNLYSAYHLTRTVLPAMKEKNAGHVFNMCSIASLKAYPAGGAYGISKFALYGFSQNLREELKPHGIKVTSVLPGAVMTDSWGDFDNSQHRIMEAKDIADMVYAASKLSVAACVEDIVLRPQLGDF